MNERLRNTSVIPAAMSVAAALALSAACVMPRAEAVDCETRPPIEEGQTVGDLVLDNGQGGEASVAELIEGKVAVIDVWATWCQPCIVALPHLEKLQAQYAERGFTVVGVLVDANAQEIGPKFVTGREIDYPVLYDNDGDRMMCDWGEFYAVPTMYIIDRDGTVLDVFSGVGDLNAIDRRLEEIFGEPVEGSGSAIL